jgi:hypothetical protein
MKKSTAAVINHASLHSPVLTRTLRPYYQRKMRKLQTIDPGPSSHRPAPATPPPSEEMINRLNCIGREYPFCVYYREKKNDPL